MLQQDLAETLSRPNTMLFKDSSCMCRDCIWYTTRARNMSNDHFFGSTYKTRIQNAEIPSRANLHHLRLSLEGQWSKTTSSLRTTRVHRSNCSPVQLNTFYQILARNVVVLVHQPAYRNVEAQKLIRRAEVRLDATYTACPASTNTRTTTHISNIET